ncbi:hypothetical protein NQ318_022649 [Aromia moschata]|uniref:Transposase n=1 Tax=Aromia moschata TaxID=1265417 RepID=A0AAV8YLT4_9CUCU|nr:hypothetical protein NQ318_022649 [Aromia moschata]
MAYVRKAKKRPYADQVFKFIADFPDLIYDGMIKCKVCQIDLQCWDKGACRRHVNSTRHIKNQNGVTPKTQFMFDLLFVLVTCGVPFLILDRLPFREFWKKYCPDVDLPSRTALRNYVTTVREDVVNRIKCALKNKRLWLCVDETTDCKKNSIVNVIVRVMDPLKPTVPLLLASKRLTECTGQTITWVVLETLAKFQVPPSQVLMLVTDGDTTMRLVGRYLQEQGCRLLHVTCKVHALHLVAERIRKCFPEVDALIASTEKVFLKSPKHLRAFHAQCPGVREPSQSILTRFGTWLEAALYYAQYFQQIKVVVLQFNPAEAAGAKESQTKFRDISIETDLQIVRNNYKGLYGSIEKLQNGALSLVESLQILDEVDTLLHTIDDARNDRVLEEFESVKKDSDFITLKQISDGVSTNPLTEFKECFNYACVTSTDVERSFTKYKHIFRQGEHVSMRQLWKHI